MKLLRYKECKAEQSVQGIGTGLPISPQSKQKSVTFHTGGVLTCCYLVSSLFISVCPHIHLLNPGKTVECLSRLEFVCTVQCRV